MGQLSREPTTWRRARRSMLERMKFWRRLCLTTSLLLGMSIAATACRTPIVLKPPKPCPRPNTQARIDMRHSPKDLDTWHGEILRFCKYIDALRKGELK